MKTYSNPQTSILEFDMHDNLMQSVSPMISISGSEKGSGFDI